MAKKYVLVVNPDGTICAGVQNADAPRGPRVIYFDEYDHFFHQYGVLGLYYGVLRPNFYR